MEDSVAGLEVLEEEWAAAAVPEEVIKQHGVLKLCLKNRKSLKRFLKNFHRT